MTVLKYTYGWNLQSFAYSRACQTLLVTMDLILAMQFSGRVLPPRPHNASDADFHPEFDMGSGPHFPHPDPDSDGEHDDEHHSWWPHHHNHSHGGNHTHCNRTMTAFKKASCKGHSVGIFSKHNTTVEDAVAAAPELANFVPIFEADGFLGVGTGAVADAEMLGALGHGPSKMVSKCLGFGLHVAGIKRSGGPHPPGPGPHPHPPHHPHHHHHDEEESEGYGDETDILQLPEDAEVLEGRKFIWLRPSRFAAVGFYIVSGGVFIWSCRSHSKRLGQVLLGSFDRRLSMESS